MVEETEDRREADEEPARIRRDDYCAGPPLAPRQQRAMEKENKAGGVGAARRQYRNSRSILCRLGYCIRMQTD